MHPDLQDRVYDELLQEVNDDSFSYELLGRLRYLEKVISETLRLYPVTPSIRRMTQKTRTLGNITIPQGSEVIIPVENIHYDPRFYPEPNKFDPDRFSEEAKAARPPLAYLPFGGGPRHCPGSRLALMELKVALARILCKVRVEVNERTKPKQGEQIRLSNRPLTAPLHPVKLAVSLR